MSALLLWESDGVTIRYDSRVAAGGVSLGIVTVPSGGGSFAFPDFKTSTGFVLSAGRGMPTLFTTDYALGYLRFNFSSVSSGAVVALFAK